MYKSFYSLARTPFSKDIVSSDAYHSPNHHGALNALQYLQKSKEIGLLIGDPGVGKTFTLRSFKDSLNPSLYHVVYFPLSTGDVTWGQLKTAYLVRLTWKKRLFDF